MRITWTFSNWNLFREDFGIAAVKIRARQLLDIDRPFVYARLGRLPAKSEIVGVALLMRLEIALELFRICD